MDRYEKRPMAGTTERCRKKKQQHVSTLWAVAATLTVIAWVAAFVWNGVAL